MVDKYIKVDDNNVATVSENKYVQSKTELTNRKTLLELEIIEINKKLALLP